jgi:BON domain
MGILVRTIGTAASVVRLGTGLVTGTVGRLLGGGGGAPEAPAGPPQDRGGVDLAQEVRSAVFRGMPAREKNAIDVEVVDGAVYLRGTARNAQQVRTLEARARAIPEVTDVHVLLELPETSAEAAPLAAS